MKYFIATLLVVVALAGCSNDNLSYSAKSANITVEGKSKTDEATAKAAGAINQAVLDSVDK